jgi:hypothetical protein
VAVDHLLDDVDLRRRVRLVLDAVRDEVELAAVVLLIVLRTGFHRQEEFVRQRFHDERYLRFLGALGERVGRGERCEAHARQCGGGNEDTAAGAVQHKVLLSYSAREQP